MKEKSEVSEAKPNEAKSIEKEIDIWNTLCKVINDPKNENIHYTTYQGENYSVKKMAVMYLRHYNTASGMRVKNEIISFFSNINLTPIYL